MGWSRRAKDTDGAKICHPLYAREETLAGLIWPEIAKDREVWRRNSKAVNKKLKARSLLLDICKKAVQVISVTVKNLMKVLIVP